MDEIKPEVKERCDFGIQLEEVTAEKQKLETQRDDSLAKMEAKIENLMWWDEASKKTYTAPVKEEDKTKTSSTKRPSMLPEGTVVEEIPQKVVVPLDNKTTAAKPDAKPTEDSIPTTSTTAAPAPETKVEEKEVPPKRMFPKSNIVHHFHPIAWVEQMRLVFGDEGICVCEARVRAFMTMLRIGEGTLEDIGYETIVGGSHFKDYGKNFSNHPEIYIEKYDSTAAGAYQITKTNWNDIAFVKWRENKKVIDFFPISQDKYCFYLLQKKRKAIDLIKKGYINEAIFKVRKEWASLPGSGHGQREEKLSIVINKYIEFYKNELKGITQLKIPYGGFEKFGFDCNCQNNNETDTTCGKTHIDVTNLMIFYDQGSGNSNCNKTCKSIMLQMQVIAEGATTKAKIRPNLPGSYYQIAEENLTRDGFAFDEQKSIEGISYLDKALEHGDPILFGVNHTYKYRKFGTINDDSTDHYVIVTGRKCLDGKTIYTYWDVGTKYGGKGDYYFTLENNKLTSSSRSKKYTVTQIRRNLNLNGKIIQYN